MDLFLRSRMFYLNLFAKPKMPCFSLRILRVCGSHADQSNRVQYKSQCRSLPRKDLLQRYSRCWHAADFDDSRTVGLYDCMTSLLNDNWRIVIFMFLFAMQILPPPISRTDFDKVLVRQRPTVSKADLDVHERFTKEFGEEG